MRIEFFGDEVENPLVYGTELERVKIRDTQSIVLYAANQFIVGANRLQQAFEQY